MLAHYLVQGSAIYQTLRHLHRHDRIYLIKNFDGFMSFHGIRATIHTRIKQLPYIACHVIQKMYSKK